MSQLVEVPLVSKNGIHGKVLTSSRLLDDRPQKTVIFESGREALVPSNRLHLRSNGTYFLDMTVDPRAPQPDERPTLSPSPSEPAPQLAEAEPPSPQPALRKGDIVIPRIEEQAEVTKRVVATGRVRVEKNVVDDPITIDEPTIHETYDVRRVPVGRVVDEAEPARIEGDVTVVPVYEEETVTSKRLVLKEEVHLVKKRHEEHHPQTVNLKKEKVRVERVSFGSLDPKS